MPKLLCKNYDAFRDGVFVEIVSSFCLLDVKGRPEFGAEVRSFYEDNEDLFDRFSESDSYDMGIAYIQARKHLERGRGMDWCVPDYLTEAMLYVCAGAERQGPIVPETERENS